MLASLAAVQSLAVPIIGRPLKSAQTIQQLRNNQKHIRNAYRNTMKYIEFK